MTLPQVGQANTSSRLGSMGRHLVQAGQSPETSLALRFWLQDADVTLDDAQVEACMATLLDALVKVHGVRQRA